MKNYIVDGRVAREEIASDICDGILTKDDIIKLVSNDTIKSSFIGESFDKKIPKEKWNKEYLKKLPNYAIAECFNEDYLLYIFDVADYVEKSKRSIRSIISENWKFIVFILALVTIVALIVCSFVSKETSINVKQTLSHLYEHMKCCVKHMLRKVFRHF